MSLLSGSLLASAMMRGSRIGVMPIRRGVMCGVFKAGVPVRMFSTQPSHHHGKSDVQALVERDHFMKVRTILENDKRSSIPYSDFVNTCAAAGLSKDQAAHLCTSLSDSGVVLHFRDSANSVLRDTVYIKPAEFNNTVSRLLGQLSSNTFLQQKYEEAQKALTELQQHIAPLSDQRSQLEKQANTRANTIIITGLLYCVLQAAAVARLTWWELSWDIMEPVTYMLTFGTAIIGYSYFVMTGSEYTYEGLKHTLRSRKLAKLLKRRGFDEGTYEKLATAIRVKTEEIARLASQMEQYPSHIFLEQPKATLNLSSEGIAAGSPSAQAATVAAAHATSTADAASISAATPKPNVNASGAASESHPPPPVGYAKKPAEKH